MAVGPKEGGGGGGGAALAFAAIFLAAILAVALVSGHWSQTDVAPRQQDFLNLEYFFAKIYQFFQPSGDGGVGMDLEGGISWGQKFRSWYTTILSLLSLLAIVIAVYSFIRLLEIRRREDEHLDREIKETMRAGEKRKKVDERWERIVEHVNSANSNDWRIAVIEADTILDELLIKAGFLGEDLGERLKNIPAGTLMAVNSAWEAHKVRNQIAHGGLDFHLSQRETSRVINLYESVFKELGFLS